MRKIGKSSRKAGKKGKAEAPGLETFVSRGVGKVGQGDRVGFPANKTVELVYVSSWELESALGAQAKWQFRLNSVYDPDYTNAGGQPRGFDQWALFYNHYVVEACTYEVTAGPRSTTQNMYYQTYISDDGTVPSTKGDIAELGGVTAFVVPGQPAHIFKGKIETAKFFNRKDIAADNELRALVTTNPIEEVYLSVIVYTADLTATVTSDIFATLKYRVRFMEPKDLGPSLSLGKVDKSPLKGKFDKSKEKGDEYEYVRVKKVESSE
jgi:hypothetical protein